MGSISISSHLVRTYLDGYDYLVYFFDRDTRTIGLKPMREKTPNAYSIKRYKGGRMCTVSAIAFLRHCEIPFDKTRSYPCRWNENHGMLEVRLDQELAPRSG
jgi:hypothetical protein